MPRGHGGSSSVPPGTGSTLSAAVAALNPSSDDEQHQSEHEGGRPTAHGRCLSFRLSESPRRLSADKGPC